jgi:hypothetical protein
VVDAKQERVCIGDGAFDSEDHKSDPGRNFPARGFESVVNRGVDEDRLVARKEGVGLAVYVAG